MGQISPCPSSQLMPRPVSHITDAATGVYLPLYLGVSEEITVVRRALLIIASELAIAACVYSNSKAVILGQKISSS